MSIADSGNSEKTTMAKKTKAPEVPTLKDLCSAYIASIQMDGRSSGTAASYENDLKVATKFFGEDATLLDMTRDRINEYFHCDAVMKKRNGEMKNAISVAKTRRILRLALVWAADSGWIGEAPIPETPTEKAARHGNDEPDIDDAPTGITIAVERVDPAVVECPNAEPSLPNFDHPELTRDEPAAEAPVAAPKKKGGKKAKATAAAE
jgi:hypothetical protein